MRCPLFGMFFFPHLLLLDAAAAPRCMGVAPASAYLRFFLQRHLLLLSTFFPPLRRLPPGDLPRTTRAGGVCIIARPFILFFSSSGGLPLSSLSLSLSSADADGVRPLRFASFFRSGGAGASLASFPALSGRGGRELVASTNFINMSFPIPASGIDRHSFRFLVLCCQPTTFGACRGQRAAVMCFRSGRRLVCAPLLHPHGDGGVGVRWRDGAVRERAVCLP